MDMYELLNKKSPDSFALDIAHKFKQIRKSRDITQKELSAKSLVPYGTIRQFEQKGKISLQTLLVLAETLDIIDDFNLLFEPSKHKTYEELISENTRY